jgi:hypothetical protein
MERWSPATLVTVLNNTSGSTPGELPAHGPAVRGAEGGIEADSGRQAVVRPTSSPPPTATGTGALSASYGDDGVGRWDDGGRGGGGAGHVVQHRWHPARGSCSSSSSTASAAWGHPRLAHGRVPVPRNAYRSLRGPRGAVPVHRPQCHRRASRVHGTGHGGRGARP